MINLFQIVIGTVLKNENKLMRGLKLVFFKKNWQKQHDWASWEIINLHVS